MYRGFLKKKLDEMVFKLKNLVGSGDGYRHSKKRLEVMHAYIREGDKAETLKDFVTRYVESIERDILDELAKGDTDEKELKYRYRAVLSFKEEIYMLISLGNKKREEVQRLALERQGRM